MNTSLQRSVRRLMILDVLRGLNRTAMACAMTLGAMFALAFNASGLVDPQEHPGGYRPVWLGMNGLAARRFQRSLTRPVATPRPSWWQRWQQRVIAEHPEVVIEAEAQDLRKVAQAVAPDANVRRPTPRL